VFLAIRRVAGWGRIGLIVAAPLAIGSVHPGVVTAESLSCIALLALTLLPGHRSSGWDRTYTVPWAAVALGSALLLTLLQLVPLPSALAGTGAAAPEGAWRAASLDPPATALGALRIAGLAALVTALGIVVRREGLGAIRRVLWAIAAAGAVTVGLGVIGLALDVHEVLGPCLPAQPGPAAVLRGTFVSPLHQAAFHGMAAISGLALALDRRTERWRPLAVVLGCVSTIGLAASLQPAAWIASGVGALVLLGAIGAVRHRSGARAAPYVAASVATMLLVATASLAVAGDVPEPADGVAAAGPGAGAWSRADALHAAMDMARDFPLLGVGRGLNIEAAHMHLEAANLAPGNPEPLFAAVAALVAGGTTRGADAVLARLDELCGTADCRWRLAKLRSRIHEENGLVVAAIGALEEADRLVPGDADVLMRIADMHAAAGDHGSAAVALRRLLARHPGHARAAERLGGLGTPAPAPAPEQPSQVGEPPATQRSGGRDTRRGVW